MTPEQHREVIRLIGRVQHVAALILACVVLTIFGAVVQRARDTAYFHASVKRIEGRQESIKGAIDRLERAIGRLEQRP